MVLTKNFTPTESQLKVLNKGLTFIPTFDTHKHLKLQLEKDIQSYHRRLLLTIYYKDTKTKEKTPFTTKSDWIPPLQSAPLEIQQLIKKDLEDIKKRCIIRTEEPNLTKEELQALQELKRDKNIIIKPADKGNAVVIQSRNQYIKEAHRQLNNDKYYKKLQSPIYPDTINMIKKITQTLVDKKFINKKQKQYLDGEGNVRERRFYTLPKIHKEPEKWDPPFITPPGRPIVSDCSSESHRTAEFVEHHLHPLSIVHPSYIKDTYHFIELIRQLKIPKNSLLFTIDIDNLYTNINTESGIKAVKNIFQRYPNKKRPEKELIQLLTINLTRNDFVFDSQYYLQIQGTAMGKKFAPSYANIFMAQWETGALESCPLRPIHYHRYLDDIFGIWTYTLSEFHQFIDVLNSHDPSIKTKFTIHETAVDFLDTTVFKDPEDNQKLKTKVFFKKTDTHTLLHKTSFHPKHTFKGLIKSQLIRFDRICSNAQDFWEAKSVLFKVLRKRGYSRTFLRHCLRTFQNKSNKIKDEKILPIITRFSTSSVLANKILKNNHKFFNLSKFLPNHKIITAHRKNNNLGDILVRAKLPTLNPTRKKEIPKYFHHKEFVRNQLDKRIFHIPHKYPPQTKNCVYLIHCTKCNKQYVGETSNNVNQRMWQHKYNIIHHKETHTPLVTHFIKHNWLSLKIMILEHNPNWTDKNRKKAEKRWIYLLNSKEPIGLNQKWLC